MNNDPGTHRRWRRRGITVIGLGASAAVALAAPAVAHPVFSNDQPGFPNPYGGTGVGTQTPPYAAGSRNTLNMYLPFEQDGVVYNGAENTTVDVKVTIPAGWTSPACGNASTSPPVGYRQIGTVVPGWSCVIENVNAHQVLHWHGPQVSAGQTHDDSAQFFTFQVTVPSPASTTSYGATGSSAEGFYVEQVYASTTAFSLWRTPNSTRPGEIANGIVRTVSNSSAPPPKQTGPPPPPEYDHGGPPLPGTTPSAAKPPPAKPPAAQPPAANPPAAQPPAATPPPGDGGSASAPAGGPSPAGTPAAASGGAAQDSPGLASPGPSPGTDAQSSSATQLAQQGDQAAGQGIGWQLVAGLVIAAALLAGAVITMRKRRRRPS